ncbi:hypothetical protein LguiA_018190 [Lonicera macranthoides]
MDDEDSPLTVKSDFFSTVSEKLHQKRQQEQLCLSSPDETDKTCSPLDIATNMKSPLQLNCEANATPEKRQANVTPKKRRASATPKRRQRVCVTPKKTVTNSSPNETCSVNPIQSENTPQPIPNLWLEAKLRAEENSRIFSGRQIHPFFSFWKTGKRNMDTTDVESKCCLTEKNKSINFSPIHVFEKVQDDAFALDWGNWIFSERNLLSTSCDLESACSPIFEGSIKSLQFDNFLNVSHQVGTSLCQNEGSSDHCPIQLEEDHEVDIGFFPEQASSVKNSDVPEQRRMSYYHRANLPENSLWTNKYQPEKAIEICGNHESVEFINEWLRLWHEKGFQTSKNRNNSVKRIEQDVDYNCYPSDSDSADIGEEDSLKNVLLVTGPVGSGKSAAIYACAKERGFQVIEVNASDWRNGALVKQRFGEAVESHWHQCAMDTPENLDNKHLLKSSPPKASDSEIIELIPLSDEDSQTAYRTHGKSVCKENGIANDQSEIKTLILFEDVDATLYEDRGFTTTIQQLAETAKRPMILTSNSNNPVLPNNLDKIEVCFDIPSEKELLDLVYMVCAAEEAKIQPWLVERFIGLCQGDIRKTIMHLQFWCQGHSYREYNQVKKIYDPLGFDLDAGHRILPKIIPFVFPSLLAEIVEREITKSLMMVDENRSLTGIVEEEEEELNNIEAKKEAMLSRHHSDQDDNEFTPPFGTPCKVSNSMDSPIAFTRRNIRSKPDAVVSSDSEEELVSVQQFNDTNNVEKMGADFCQYSETADFLNFNDFNDFNDTCKSFDVSCVPESLIQQPSFVPETEIDNGSTLFSATVSCAHVSNYGSMVPELLPVEAGSDQTLECFCNTGDINIESTHGEGVGDSHVEHVESVTREHQVMDECSRMDFSRSAVSMEKPGDSVAIDFVQETWRKLRDCDMGLRQYVTLEQKDTSQVLKLASGMSNLISEADLLLSDCQAQICDSLEPSMVPCEKSHSFSWCEDQLQMTSTMAQHGMCLYAKEISVVGSNIDSLSRVDLAWEMLTSSTNTMALGKLVNQEKRTIQSLETGSSKISTLLQRERESRFGDIVQSIVPSKAYLASKGDAFHEYLSSLSAISRSEAFRLSESIDMSKKRRRARVARNYLTTGALDLSPEDISLLSQYNSYWLVSTQSTDSCLR